MDGNPISSIPDWIGEKLVDVEKLELNDCSLSSIPSAFGELTKLKELKLYNNDITAIPSSFGRLTRLRKLYLSNNKIDAFPASVLNALGRDKAPFLLGLESNYLSAAALSEAFSAYSPAVWPEAPEMLYLALVGHNPACNASATAAAAPPTSVGPWQIKCSGGCGNERASACLKTSFRGFKTRIGNSKCDLGCNTSVCSYDGGDCLWPEPSWVPRKHGGN